MRIVIVLSGKQIPYSVELLCYVVICRKWTYFSAFIVCGSSVFWPFPSSRCLC